MKGSVRVVSAVNSLDEYGEWCNDVSDYIAYVDGIIARQTFERRQS